jgi:cobyrinic acid a,c-diamide synthase
MHIKPVGHGYAALTIDQPNPFFDIGAEIKGHEFHYSGIADNQNEAGLEQLKTCMAIRAGVGLGHKRDGLMYNNTFACYTHIHALGMKSWALNLVKAASVYHNNNGHSGRHGRNGFEGNDFAEDDSSQIALHSR